MGNDMRFVFRHMPLTQIHPMAQLAAEAAEAAGAQGKVKEDFMSAVRSGAAGTPSFFINGEPYEGSFDDESLIDALHFAAQSRATHVTKGYPVPGPRAH